MCECFRRNKWGGAVLSLFSQSGLRYFITNTLVTTVYLLPLASFWIAFSPIFNSTQWPRSRRSRLGQSNWCTLLHKVTKEERQRWNKATGLQKQGVTGKWEVCRWRANIWQREKLFESLNGGNSRNFVITEKLFWVVLPKLKDKPRSLTVTIVHPLIFPTEKRGITCEFKHLRDKWSSNVNTNSLLVSPTGGRCWVTHFDTCSFTHTAKNGIIQF